MADTEKKIKITVDGAEALSILDEIKAALKETSAALLKLNDSLTVKVNNSDAKTKIKDVGTEMDNTKSKTVGFSESLRNLKNSFSQNNIMAKGFGGALGEATTAFGGLIKASWAFVATPVGAIITGVVVAVTALVAIFKSFKPLVDGIQQAFAGVAAVFNTFKSAIFSFVSGSKSLDDSFSNLGTKMKNAAVEAANLKKAQQELEDSAAALEVQNRQNEVEIQKLILQSKNRTLSEKERMALIDQATVLEENQYKKRQEFNDKEVANAEKAIQIKAGLSDDELDRLKKEGLAFAKQVEDKGITLDDEIKTLKDAYIKKEDLESQNVAMMEKAQNRRDALAEKQLQNSLMVYDLQIADIQSYINNLEAVIVKEKEVSDNIVNTFDERKKAMETMTVAINEQRDAEVKILDLKIKKLELDYKITRNVQDQVQIKELQTQKEKVYSDALTKSNVVVKDSNALLKEQIDLINKSNLSADERIIKEKEYTDQIISDADIINAKTTEKSAVLKRYNDVINEIVAAFGKAGMAGGILEKQIDDIDVRTKQLLSWKPEDLAKKYGWREDLVEFDTFETLIAKQKLDREKKTAEETYKIRREAIAVNLADQKVGTAKYTEYMNAILDIDNDYNIKKKEFGEKYRSIERVNRETNIKNEMYDTEREINNINLSYKERLYIIDRFIGTKTERLKNDADQTQGFLNDEKVRQNLLEQDIYETKKYYSELAIKLKQEERNRIFDKSLQLVNSLQSIDQAATQRAINLQQGKLDRQEISQEQFDDKIANIQKEAAKREKAYAIASAVISTAQAMIGMLTVKPVTFLNFALAAAAGILGALQIAKIVSTPLGSATGGGGGGGVSTPSQTTAPNTSFTFQQPTGQGTTPAPIKTFVLTKDVNTASQMDRQVVSNGSL